MLHLRMLGVVGVIASTALLAGCAASTSSAAAQLATPAPATTSSSAVATPSPSASASPLLSTQAAEIAALGQSPTLVTIGDSIMAGFGLDDGADWPTLIAKQDGLKITNLACSGAGFIAVGQCGTDFSGLVSQAVRASPSIVVVESSSNDLGESDDDIAAATTGTVAKLHAALPNAIIVGLSTIWNEDATVPHEVTSSSAALQSAVDAVGGMFFDIGQPLLGHAEWMQSDDVHPTAAGQQQIAAVVRQALLGAGFPV